MLPTLVANAPERYSAYLEPFAGSACLFFALQPDRAVIGDFNAELIDAYQIIAEAPKAVARALSIMPTDPEFYYELRARKLTSLPRVVRAARFVYLNRFSFNGVYRTNRAGLFNVPRGEKTGQLPKVESLVAVARVLENATLMPPILFLPACSRRARGNAASFLWRPKLVSVVAVIARSNPASSTADLADLEGARIRPLIEQGPL